MGKRILISLLAGASLVCIIAFLPGYRPVNHVFFANLKSDTVEIMAHGAGQGVAPTNTLLALKTAYAAKADILEVDVQLTRDNVLVLHHDDTLDRTTDLAGTLASKTWAQIAAADKGSVVVINNAKFSGADTKVSRLDDALKAFPDARWNIEIKNDSTIAAQQTCLEVRKAGLASKALIASFHDDAMAAFRRQCPEVATSMAPKEIRAFVIAAHLGLSRFVKTHGVAVQVPVSAGGFNLTNPRIIAAFKARNIKLHYWTINEPAQMDALIQAGADGLLTDFVTLGQEAKLRGLRGPRPSHP
jgi:glycerophosphoryl diester phosphodiesterase